MFSNKIYIKDISWYDLATQNNVSKYTANSETSITYDSTEQAYLLTYTRDGMRSITLNNLRFTNKCKISAEVMHVGGNGNVQIGIGLLNNNIGVESKFTRYPYGNESYFTFVQPTRTTYGDNETTNPLSLTPSDVWYTIIVEFNENSMSATLKQGDNIISTQTYSSNVLSNDSNELAFWVGYFRNASSYIKNIKIHEL